LLRLVIISVLIAGASIIALVFCFAAVALASIIFVHSSAIPANVFVSFGNIAFEAFAVLVVAPLHYLYGRILYKDLEQARGYTYTDEEKKRASRIVLWAPIISIVGVIVLICVPLAMNLFKVQDAQLNIKRASDAVRSEDYDPQRSLNR